MKEDFFSFAHPSTTIRFALNGVKKSSRCEYIKKRERRFFPSFSLPLSEEKNVACIVYFFLMNKLHIFLFPFSFLLAEDYSSRGGKKKGPKSCFREMFTSHPSRRTLYKVSEERGGRTEEGRERRGEEE